MQERKVEQILSGGWYQWEGRRHILTGEGGQIWWKFHASCMKIELGDLLKLF
jgi:hypothetical protein